MKRKFTSAVLVIACMYVCSCATVAPVNTCFEKAGTLGKGNIELLGNVSRYIASSDGESEATNNNVGLKVGYGISDVVDLKIRYERLMPVDNMTRSYLKVNYISVIPKFMLADNVISLIAPISMYHFKEQDNGYKSVSRSYSIAPQLLTTFTNQHNEIDFTISAKADYIINSDALSNDFLIGFNMGAGFSSDLDKWAVRPEIGYLTKPGETGHIWSLGIGFQFVLGKKNGFY